MTHTHFDQVARDTGDDPFGAAARAHFEAWMARDPLTPFGLGKRPALINVDLQRRYTDTGSFGTAYPGHPEQFTAIDALASALRGLGLPVVWTYVAYRPDGSDCGLWGRRSTSPTAIHTVTEDHPHAELDPRLDVDRARDLVLRKRMASAFFETHLPSYLRLAGVDSVIVTGGATSGCVRQTAVDAMSSGLPVTLPLECVADREPGPHYANLYDMATKYADIRPVVDVLSHLAHLKDQK
ncbi:isochorismatase family protein [Salipiger abyssi]|uniref:isochorismatase family protein n=1 Tax=Salipiger abyssi TaxID=1250539 RepID=UPI001F37206B|nr:isochorismatase family protein [Salipiger abyssi]